MRKFPIIIAGEPIVITEMRAYGSNAFANDVEIIFGRKGTGSGHFFLLIY
jgi:hypothetical protein